MLLRPHKKIRRSALAQEQQTAGLCYASGSHIGRRRKRNEDALTCLPDQQIYAVADGMGGAKGGDFSSQTVVRILGEVFKAKGRNNELAKDIQRFREALNQASQLIKVEAERHGHKGMGTTVVALLLSPGTPEEAVILHAGDSRVYRCRKGRLSRLTRDHSIAEEAGLSDSNYIPAFMQGVITRAVGIHPDIDLECTPVEVAPGDTYLLCSDGLYNMLDQAELQQQFTRHAENVGDLTYALIEAANAAGGMDNITAITLRIED